MDSDISTQLYNDKIKQLSQSALEPCRLENPDATADAVSMICGSTVSIDIQIDKQTHIITKFGFETESCALTRTVLALVSDIVIGQSFDDVRQAHLAMKNMLEGKGIEGFIGKWSKLSILEPVKDYKARHNSILLTFVALEKSFKSIS